MVGLEDNVELLLNVLEGEWRNPEDLEGLENGQMPQFVAVLCSDSRGQSNDVSPVPRNSVFHPSTIGNQVLGITGSLAYPIGHLESVKLALVIGHIGCGAINHAYEMAPSTAPIVSGSDINEVVKNAVDYFEGTGASRRLLPTNGKSPSSIKEELLPMAQLFASARQFLQGDEVPYLVKHSIANVYMQVTALLRLPEVHEKLSNEELVVAGLLHDFAGKMGRKGSMYLVSYNGKFSGLETTPVAASLNGRGSLILPEKKFL